MSNSDFDFNKIAGEDLNPKEDHHPGLFSGIIDEIVEGDGGTIFVVSLDLSETFEDPPQEKIKRAFISDADTDFTEMSEQKGEKHQKSISKADFDTDDLVLAYVSSEVEEIADNDVLPLIKLTRRVVDR